MASTSQIRVNGRAAATNGHRLFRRSWFLPAQLAIWTGIHAFSFGGTVPATLAGGAPLFDVVVVFGVSIAVTVLCSCALAWQLDRVFERRPLGFRSILDLVGLSVLAALLWTFVIAVLFLAVVDGFLAPQPATQFLEIFWFHLLLMWAWTAFWLAAKLLAHAQAERERSLRLEALAREAQLRCLRAQLNPHFLFNSLNSLIELMRIDVDRAEQMILDITRLLRRTVDASRVEGATLAQEVGFVLEYLRCEQIRFPERLQVRVSVPESLLDEPLPNLLLQPLVENAVKHGMAGNRSITIEIVARRELERLIVDVKNTGALRTLDGDSPRNGGAGVGLSIVRERLATRYPRTGSFELRELTDHVVARVVFDPGEPAAARHVPQHLPFGKLSEA